jgi:hypothetical protein
MSSDTNYTFNNMDRMGDDQTTHTQRELQNDRFSTYALTNYFSENPKDAEITFATEQPVIIPNNSTGTSVGGNNIVNESSLIIEKEKARNLGRLNLMERPFLTVPYLGKGSVDPVLELQLKEGELFTDKKSTSTIMSQSFMGYTMYPTSKEMEERVSDTRHSVEESALKGWVRGGIDTRLPEDDELSSKGRPGLGSV